MFSRRTANPINVSRGGEIHPTKFDTDLFASTGRLNGNPFVFPTIRFNNNLYGFVGSPKFIPPTSLPLITPVFWGIVKEE